MALPEEVVESARVPRLRPYSQGVRVGDPVRSAPVITLPRGLLFSVDAIAVAERAAPAA